MKHIGKYISASALYAGSMVLLLLLFSELWRFILMLHSHDLSSAIPSFILLKSFLIGARFDLRVISPVVLLLFLLGTIPFLDISRSRFIRKVNSILLGVIAAVIFFLHLVDIDFFSYFNSRLNGSALLWSDRPGDIFSMIWHSYHVIWSLLLYLVILFAFLFLVRFITNRILQSTGKTSGWITLLYIPVVVIPLVIGSIGRIHEVAPMRWGLAFFSEYNFANQLALNPVYTFARDVFYDAGKRHHIEQLVNEITFPEAEQITAKLLGVSFDTQQQPRPRLVRHVSVTPENSNPPNVIVIIMESFASSKIGCLKSKYPYDLSPRFDSLSQHGILFTNCYSSGTHTYSGLFTTLYGTPHLFGKVLMKQVQGHYHYWGLPSILSKKGYETLFFTTQDPHFDNMQGFLMAHGVKHVYSVFDYGKEKALSWLGVPDHVMFDYAHDRLRELAQSGKRFFAALLTGSNHAPWFIPDVPFEHIPDSEKRHMELNAFKYSDWALGRFIEQIAGDSVLDNTLIVVTADNGFKYDVTTDLDISILQIPLFLYNTSWGDSVGIRSDRLGCQFDILPTVMGQVGLSYDNYSFGTDLLDSNSTGTDFVFSTRWYEVGYIEDGYYLILRLNHVRPPSLFKLTDKTTDLAGELPEKVEEYKRKALAIYQTAFYNLHRPITDEQQP